MDMLTLDNISTEFVNNKTILFYDSDCLICSFFIKYVYRKDKKELIYFSDFHSKLANDLGISLSENSMVLIKNGVKHIRTNALIEILCLIEFPQPFIFMLKLIPIFIRDMIYTFVANHRKIFNHIHSSSCSIELNKRIIQ